MNIDELFYRKLKSYAKEPGNITWTDMEKRLEEELLLQHGKSNSGVFFRFIKSARIWIVAGLLVSMIAVGAFMLYQISKDSEDQPSATASSMGNVVSKDTLFQSDFCPQPLRSQTVLNTDFTTETTPQYVDTPSTGFVETMSQPSIESRQSDVGIQDIAEQPTHTSVPSPVVAAAATETHVQESDKDIATTIAPKEYQPNEKNSIPLESPVSDEVFATLSSLEKEMETHLRIPNFMSPNFDGQNDVFHIAGLEKFPKHELKIFTQRGVVLLHTKHYTRDWTAENVPNGVYFYILRVEKGSETAIRRGVIHVER